MAQDLKACCCPCYPVWYKAIRGSSSGGGGELEIIRSPLFAWNTIDPANHGPIPRFIGVKINPPPNASSGGIDGPTSPLDRRVYDVELVPEFSTINDADPQSILCSNLLWYCGKHQVNLNVPKLDDSGTVLVTELTIIVIFSVQDWDYLGECRFPRFLVETYIFATIDQSGGRGGVYVGSQSTGGPGTITSVADGWLTVIPQPLGYATAPPTGGGVISFPPTFNPDLPILVSPIADETSDPTDYLYPLRNRSVTLQCSKRKTLREENQCEGDETPIEPQSSSGWGTTSYTYSTSGGGSSVISSDSSGGGASGSGGLSIGAFYIEALVCGTDAPSGLYFDFTGVDDGQVWRQPDGTCVYADLLQEATETSTPAVDLTDPRVSCDTCVAAPCSCPVGLDDVYVIAGGFDFDTCICAGFTPKVGQCMTGDAIAVSRSDTACFWQCPILGDCPGQEDYGSATIELDTINCRWVLSIGSSTDGGDDIWLGYKSVGLTPAGTYTRASGCDSTATMTVT
jgi:hypothetical protein